MKIFAAAMALALAVPAAAQTAPAPQPDHGQMQMPMNHADHAQHQGMQHGTAQSGQAEHDGCCQDRNGDGRMDCCEHMAQATEQRDCCAEHGQQPAAQHQGHSGH